MKTIPQRELRNNISRVLRDVEAGERVRVTVAGRPVADLVPIEQTQHTFVPRRQVEELLERTPLDPGFAQDIEFVTSQAIDEL